MKVVKTNDGLVKIVLGMSSLFSSTNANPAMILDKIVTTKVEEYLDLLFGSDNPEIDTKAENPKHLENKDKTLDKIQGELNGYLKLTYQVENDISIEDLTVSHVDGRQEFTIITAEEGKDKIMYLKDLPIFNLVKTYKDKQISA